MKWLVKNVGHLLKKGKVFNLFNAKLKVVVSFVHPQTELSIAKVLLRSGTIRTKIETPPCFKENQAINSLGQLTSIVGNRIEKFFIREA